MRAAEIKKIRAKALKHLQKIRELVAKHKSPLAGMSAEAVIAKLRRDRQAIWNEKYAHHS